jgi:hypothetical protein
VFVGHFDEIPIVDQMRGGIVSLLKQLDAAGAFSIHIGIGDFLLHAWIAPAIVSPGSGVETSRIKFGHHQSQAFFQVESEISQVKGSCIGMRIASSALYGSWYRSQVGRCPPDALVVWNYLAAVPYSVGAWYFGCRLIRLQFRRQKVKIGKPVIRNFNAVSVFNLHQTRWIVFVIEGLRDSQNVRRLGRR